MGYFDCGRNMRVKRMRQFYEFFTENLGYGNRPILRESDMPAIRQTLVKHSARTKTILSTILQKPGIKQWRLLLETNEEDPIT